MRYITIWSFFMLLLFFSVEMKGQEVAEVRYTTDAVPPQVYCINGLAINFTDKNRERTISAKEINLGSFDNIGIKVLKLENHRPDAVAPRNDATDKIAFTVKDLGKHKIDLWVGDFGGNWSRKSTYVLVSDIRLKNEIGASKIDAINYPNPFSDQTQIRFTMDSAGPAVISILNNKGNLIKEITSVYPKGKQIIEINKSDLPSVGIYYYQITTKQGTITKNMIMVNY